MPAVLTILVNKDLFEDFGAFVPSVAIAKIPLFSALKFLNVSMLLDPVRCTVVRSWNERENRRSKIIIVEMCLSVIAQGLLSISLQGKRNWLYE